MAGALQQFRIAARATREETRQVLIATAKREHARIMKTDPEPRRFTRKVDGRVGAAEETVKFDGMIVYRYARLAEVVQAAMELLFELSPVLSGEYRKNHTLFVDGVAVANLAGWDETGEAMITNAVPYARKIEMGKMTMRVPGTDLVYQQAVSKLNRRFGSLAKVLFTYRAVIGGAVVRGSRNGDVSGTRYPALLITAR